MQVKWDCLRASGYTGTIDDMYLKFMLDAGAITRDMNDAEREWLTAQGFTVGTNDDRWFAFLRSLGYTGSRTDMEHSFWLVCDLAGEGGVDPGDIGDDFFLLLEDGGMFLLEDGGFLQLE